MKLPTQRIWTQENSGDIAGALGATTNMALDKVGKAIASRKAVSLMDKTVNANFEYVVSMNYLANKYWVMTTGGVFSGGTAGNVYEEEIDYTPSVVLNSDSVIFNGLIHVTDNTNLSSWNGVSADLYDRLAVALTAGVPHPMCIFESLPTYQLAIGDGNVVNLYNTAYAKYSTILTLPSYMQVTTMRYRNGYLYVGTRNLNGGEASIYIWDGNSNLANYACPVGCSWVFSMTEYGSTVAVITSQGQLGLVNGTTFQQLSALPIYYEPHARWQGSGGLQLNGKVFNRGMVTVGSTIYINIDGEVDLGFVPAMKSGVWVYDPSVGLYHRASTTTDNVVIDSDITVTDSVITTSTAHNLQTGDGVGFELVSGLSGVDTDITYYATVISATEIKISQTRKSLANGIFVTITGTVSIDSLLYIPNTEHGKFDSTSGAIIQTVYNETPHPLFSSEVLWGSRTNLPDGTANYTLNTFADVYSIGSITLQRQYADNIQTSWKELYNFIDGLSVESEEVIVKAQTTYETPTKVLSGVWLNKNTINSSNVDDFSAFSDIEEGYEVVIVDGYGRGRTAHVVSKTNSESTVSLILDEEYGLANELVDFYYTTFKKYGVLSSDGKLKEAVKALLGETASWIAIKLELRGFQTAVNVVDLSNATQKNSN